MSSSGKSTAPQDPDRLRAEIAETRADLADTVGSLAAKTDVKGRAKHAAADAADDAKQLIGAAAQQTRQAVSGAATAVTATAGAVADRSRTAVTSVRDSVHDADLRAQVRRPLPWTVVVAAAVAVGVAIYAVRRNRA